jgi:hypothetical protein
VPGWKKDLLTYPGRELLVKSVLFAIPTHFLTVFKFPKWAIHGINKFRRSFLWKGYDPDNIKGGHYLVNWRTCQRPRKLGGLGITDLEKFNRALCLKWLWHSWVLKIGFGKICSDCMTQLTGPYSLLPPTLSLEMARPPPSRKPNGCMELHPKILLLAYLRIHGTKKDMSIVSSQMITGLEALVTLTVLPF